MPSMGRPAKVIPLPFVKTPPPEAVSRDLVAVRRCRGQAEALVVRSVLDSEGISSVLRGHFVSALHPFSVGEQGAITVLVHAFDVLGDPVRRRILELLADGELSSGAITSVVQAEFGISQPAVSQHLRVLRESGFTSVRPEGTQVGTDVGVRTHLIRKDNSRRMRELNATHAACLDAKASSSLGMGSCRPGTPAT